jgi:hypothetical protein
MNGTLVSIDNNTAIIDFINQSTAKQERQEKPIGGTVRTHVGFLLENRIGKEVEFSVKIGLDGKEYWSFIGVPKGNAKDFKSGQEIRKEDQKMVVGLLWSADDANYKVQDANGKEHIYCVGPNNKHIMNKAVEFGTFPLTLRYSVTKDSFLSPQSQILGVPTPAEIAALTPENPAEETKPTQTSTTAPEQAICSVCGCKTTEKERSRSKLFHSKVMCGNCQLEEEAKLKGMAPPPEKRATPAPKEPAPNEEDDERPGGELISPPAPEDTRTAQPLTPGMAKAIKFGSITGLQKDRLIVLQSSLKVAADLYPCDMNMDYDQACNEVVEMAILIANRLIEEAVR